MREFPMILMLAALAAPSSTLAAERAPVVIPPPPAGKGQVVFFRQGSKLMVTSCAVNIGTERLSSLPPSRYFVHVVDPATITYRVRAETEDQLTLEIEPDRTYYVRCTIGMGMMTGRPNLMPSTKEFFDSVSSGLQPVKKEQAITGAASGG
ncbi:hypothetical protein [Thermaurantiacus sp.]